MSRFPLLTLLFLSLAAPAQGAWTVQHSIWGDGNTLTGIAAGSGLVAAAAGAISDGMGSSKAAVFSTTDGGQTWTETGLGGQLEFIFHLDLANEKIGFGGGLGFFKTTDGGKSWSSVTLPGAGFMTAVSAVQVLDPAKVFVGMESKLVRTLNTINWEATDTGIDFGILDLHFIDKDTGWIVGGEVDEQEGDPPVRTVLPNGTILRTNDGGVSFAPLVGGAEEVYSGVTFVSMNIGILVGYDKDFRYFVRRTTDGGDSWTNVELPPHPSGSDIIALSPPEMINMGQGWIVGGAGVPEGGMGNKPVFLHTWDGGLSWEHDTSYDGGGGTLFAVSFHDEHRGWACGDGGLIIGWNDGTPYIPPEPEPDAGVIPGQDAAGPDPDVWTWGKVLGSFDDEGNVGAGGGEGPGDPVDDVPAGVDGGGGGANCDTVTEATGGCSATTAPAASGGVLILLALAALGLLVPRRGALLALLVLLTACGEQTLERTVCADTTGPRWEEIATLPDLGDPTVKPAGWGCTLSTSEALPELVATTARTAGLGGAIAFVRAGEAGGSDLWLTSAEGEEVRLTWFDDPSVEVRDPAWSPDRSHLVFASDFRAGMTETRWNLFVTRVDGKGCWQVTPAAEAVCVLDGADLDATLTGNFQISVAGIGAALEGATVGFPGAPALGVTGPGGAFSVDVPSGEGQLVFEGWKGETFYRTVLTYQVDPGSANNLGPVAATEQPLAVRLARPVWTADSGRLIVLRSEEVADSLWTVPLDGSPWETWYAPAAFAPRWVSPFPDGSYLALVQSDDTHEIHLVDFAEPDDPVYTAFTADLDAALGGAVSPLNFIAVVMDGRPWIFGADPAGDLTSRPVGPDNLAVVPDQIDWSPDNTRLVVTINSAAGPNLVIIDANAGTLRTLTTDGRSSMPAWFGR
ncbi:MAG: hypothetical protein ABIK09_02875 [Pseudomonadota bacterium]